jgi:hypothetical protein
MRSRWGSVVSYCLLTFFCVHNCVDDIWKWKLDLDRGYSVHGVYQILATKMLRDISFLYDIVWIKVVPLKVTLFAWRLLQNGLPIKDNLIRRGCIKVNSNFCTCECWLKVNVDHLFVGCDLFECISSLIR